MRTPSILVAVLPLTLAVGLTVGCGSSDDDSSSPGGAGGGDASVGGTGGGTGGAAGGNGGSAGDSGSGGATGGTGATGGAAGGTGGTGWPDPDAGDGGDADADIPDAPIDVDFSYDAPLQEAGDACATATAEATPVPLDIFIMLDRSGSMGDDCNYGASTDSRWCRAVNSIGGFVQDPASVGNKAAIQYFPNGGSCSGSGYDVAAVGLGVLTGPTGFAEQIISSLNGQNPTGGNTPTEGGLRGLISFTQANNAPPRVMIGILITDGSPNGCNEGGTYMRNLLGAHYAATGIHTFVVGMDGANFSTLETISSYPGAISHTNYCGTGSSCHHYDVGGGDPAVFISALQQIQQSAVGCVFQMPTSSGGIIDPEQVTVEYSPGGNPPAQELTGVDDEASCVADGWYYDDNAAPTTINLCPDTCAMVQADQSAKVEVLLGCLGS